MEAKFKHLEFLQLVITRMTVNSFLLKGWSVTLVSALFALAAKDAHATYILITYLSTPVFWILDAYYLSLERQYRALYNEVRLKNEGEIDFDLDARKYNEGDCTWPESFFSKTLKIFYGCLLGITLIIMILFIHYGEKSLF